MNCYVSILYGDTAYACSLAINGENLKKIDPSKPRLELFMVYIQNCTKVYIFFALRWKESDFCTKLYKQRCPQSRMVVHTGDFTTRTCSRFTLLVWSQHATSSQHWTLSPKPHIQNTHLTTQVGNMSCTRHQRLQVHAMVFRLCSDPNHQHLISPSW